MTSNDSLKQQAAEYAVKSVQSDMIIGLGHGTTAIWAVRKIGQLIQAGTLRNVFGIPCSVLVEAEARELGIPLTTLEDHPAIDLTIDGADEVDPALNLIKGGGGALMREKIVAQASKREIIIVDESKVVPALGTHWAVPVEVIPFGYGSQIDYLKALGAEVKIRQGTGGNPFKTDQGNLILDCNFGPISDPGALADKIKRRTGIVEHGLFIGLATEVIIASADGIREIKREGH
ncbi:MAG: ribose-5-phosphate isomerase RpiA [Chloroflexota bacterium]